MMTYTRDLRVPEKPPCAACGEPAFLVELFSSEFYCKECNIAMTNRANLRPLVKDAFRKHIETDRGLIAGPDRLLERTVKAVQSWLKHHEGLYREHEMDEVAEALRDLRMNLIDKQPESKEP